jgi:hypothetical protein
MKKVIRLTESDLEKIIRKVIQEQSTGVAFGTEGNGFKMKREPKEQTFPGQNKSLKDLDDTTLMVFMDPFRGSDLVRAMAYLREKGLKSGGQRNFEVDPLTSRSFPAQSKQDIAADRVIDMVKSGLKTVAQNNYTDQRWFTKGFPILDDNNRDISAEILQFYPNFYSVLWGITQDQLKKV